MTKKTLVIALLVFCALTNVRGQSNTTPGLNQQIISKLKTIEDPELNVNIYDLGLVRDIKIQPGNHVQIKIIFTKLFCPYGKTLVNSIKAKVGAIPAVKSCKVTVDINTRWKREMMTEEGKKKMKETYSW